MPKHWSIRSRCVALAALVAGPSLVFAAEPAWLGAEYERRGGATGYLLTTDSREASTLDQGGSGWRRTGAILQAYDYPEGDYNVPVCRVSQGEVRGFALGATACSQYAGYSPQAFRNPNVFFLAKVGSSGACASGAPVWGMGHPSVGGLLARIGVGDPVPGMGIAKRDLQWGLCAPVTSRMRRMEAARFLDQATFGATAATIDAVVNGQGLKAWITGQMTMPATKYTQYPTYYRLVNGAIDTACTFTLADGTQASESARQCANATFNPTVVQREFYWQASEGPDQLRQRVAWAWSQLFVVSSIKEGMAYGTADYQQRLRDLAFGRFEDLLYTVSTHPMMGRMLDNLGNTKRSGTREPNENFAREMLQLFTTGTVRLNPDGSAVLGEDGRAVALYGQETITEMARAMTGWIMAPSTPPEGRAPSNLRDPMVPWTVSLLPFPNAPNAASADPHDTGAKRIFGGELMIPAGLGTEAEMRLVVKFLAEHPNTAVFISRYLIQRLVTSNPSSAYLERVVGTFRNNGNGVIGDLGAVITAILLDPEARGATRPEEDYGRMRDTVQRYVGMLRAINAKGFKGSEATLFGNPNPNPFSAPSVFGHFLADHQIAPGLYGPEFHANRVSTVLDWISRSSGLTAENTQRRVPSGERSTDYSSYAAMTGDIPRLIDHLNLTFAAGGMAPSTVNGLVDMVTRMRTAIDGRDGGWGEGYSAAESVARTAILLFFNTAQYHVQR